MSEFKKEAFKKALLSKILPALGKSVGGGVGMGVASETLLNPGLERAGVGEGYQDLNTALNVGAGALLPFMGKREALKSLMALLAVKEPLLAVGSGLTAAAPAQQAAAEANAATAEAQKAIANIQKEVARINQETAESELAKGKYMGLENIPMAALAASGILGVGGLAYFLSKRFGKDEEEKRKSQLGSDSMKLEIPSSKVSDKFYNQLSRELLFDTPEQKQLRAQELMADIKGLPDKQASAFIGYKAAMTGESPSGYQVTGPDSLARSMGDAEAIDTSALEAEKADMQNQLSQQENAAKNEAAQAAQEADYNIKMKELEAANEKSRLEQALRLKEEELERANKSLEDKDREMDAKAREVQAESDALKAEFEAAKKDSEALLSSTSESGDNLVSSLVDRMQGKVDSVSSNTKLAYYDNPYKDRARLEMNMRFAHPSVYSHIGESIANMAKPESWSSPEVKNHWLTKLTRFIFPLLQPQVTPTELFPHGGLTKDPLKLLGDQFMRGYFDDPYNYLKYR